jgi:3-dehydroquinate dehydratase/shikimate dehydrogenase
MRHPALCVTVTASTMAELRARRDEAAPLADLVELRLDGVRDLDVAGALAGRTGPVVATCRPRWEGGGFDGGEAERLSLLADAIRRGAEYVDVEWAAGALGLIAETGGRRIVLSSHDFAESPRDLPDRYRAMRATGAEVVKLAVTAHALTDCLPLLTLGRSVPATDRVALVAMGTPGWVSRILPAHFGSCWTYAGEAVAPGQLAPGRLLSEFRFGRTTASTRVFAVVGRPVEHSVSPAMHNAAFEATGVDAVYVPLAAASADDFCALAGALGVAGASVTAPFKQALVPLLANDDERVRRVGAVNTLKAEGSAWLGRNTDVEGFLAPLDVQGVPLRGQRVLVIGTGGAARAVVVALDDRGARVRVWGRDPRRAGTVATLAAGGRVTEVPTRGDWDVLVNATPVGTRPAVEDTPVDAAVLRGGRTVYDLVYNPPDTRLLRDATAAGCRVIGGLEMLVAQAAAQFEWWTGRPAPTGVMRAAALDWLRAAV